MNSKADLDVGANAKKRKSLNIGPVAKKMRTEPKNAVCALHELYRGLDFKVVEQEGPVHMPLFTISVEVNGCVFKGQGKNKKVAKHAAAEAALRSLIQLENPSDARLNIGFTHSMDFTNDVSEIDFDKTEKPMDTTTLKIESNGSGNCHPTGNQMKGKASKMCLDKGPVMLLNELHPKAKFEVVSDNGEQYKKYTMAVTIDDQRFEGTGPSKKLSKAAAARCALATLHNVSFSQPILPTPAHRLPCHRVQQMSSVPQVFADHIADLVFKKFDSLMVSDVHHGRRMVLAGVVLSKGFDKDSCRVISVSTGTKCIKGEHMSVSGTALHDCHAEIIARRCLNKFLYSELMKHSDPESAVTSIFDPFKSDVGFRLKDGYKFHLFITTAPCGDSRIFSPHDEEGEDKHPNRKARGKLRTKIESGEGTIPVKTTEGVQTWDGVLQGERLLTMSCSDKLCKWNVVGVQGSLLTKFIEPVYLESIILGSLFHSEHLYRAICGRVEPVILGLPPPYYLNKPKMALISSKEVRHTGKAPNFSVNWTEGDSEPEVVNAVTGKTQEHKISSLAKCIFFTKYSRLCQCLPSLGSPPDQSAAYGEIKESCREYQSVKQQLYAAFVKAELGTWVKKPAEAEMFEANLVANLEPFPDHSDLEKN